MMELKPSELPTLLLITDSPLKRVFFEEAIAKLENYSLLCASSLADAFESLNKTRITFIVIDENTPYIDLAEICIKIRKLKEYQHTPILIITSHLKKSFTRRLLKAGATDFLREPLENNEFFHRMDMAKEMKKTQKKMSTLTSHFSSAIPGHASMEERVILDSRAVELIRKAMKDGTSLVLFLLEIDQYVPFQKRYGSKAADALLIDFQDYLRTLMRRQDLLFSQRKGKFLVLLPRTTAKAAQFIGENIQESLEIETFRSGGVSLNLSISIGLVTLDEAGSLSQSASGNFDRLMQTANRYLNQAKKKGRAIVAHIPKKGKGSS